MRILTKAILVALATGFVSCALFSQQAQAQQITGNILFTGVVTLDTSSAGTATAITGWYLGIAGGVPFGSPIVNGASGSFAAAAGTSATFAAPWTFTAGATPLWSVLAGAFRFDLFAGSTVTHTATSVTVTGFGVVHGVGFADTPGIWSFTTQDPAVGGKKGPASFSFSSAGGAVPDGGSTVALFGLALAGLEGLRRKMRQRIPKMP